MYAFVSLQCRACGSKLLQCVTTRPTTCNCNARNASSKTHYASLGITPAATQADVKAAYYKLTKLYHPDRQQLAGPDGDDNTQKFRQVAAAYEVLGNVKLRRLYDKGMHHAGTHPQQGPAAGAWTPAEDDDPAMKFYRSREVRSRPPPPAAGTPIYDFDEWSKQHYGATFMRDQTIKKRREARVNLTADKVNDMKVERVLISMGILMVAFLILSNDLRNQDRIVYKREDASRAAPAPEGNT